MERRKSESLDMVLGRFLRDFGIEGPLNEWRLVNSWAEVVGSLVAAYTQEVKVCNQMLMVRVKSPALRANLMMQRAELVRRLNEKVGAQVIYDIRFS